jgi:hypothetical protein
MTCDKCKIQHLCIIMEKFKQPLLDTRLCLENGHYPDLVSEFYKILAKHCQYYDLHEEDDE